MATEVKLPRLGQGMESGRSSASGSRPRATRSRRASALYELETEKVTQEVEAEALAVCS